MKNHGYLILQVIIYWSLLITLPPQAQAKKPPGQLCKIMQDVYSQEYTAQELCERYRGHFCESSRNMGQAVCRAHAGAFCGTVENMGEALCRAINGQSCVVIENEAAGYCTVLGHPLEECMLVEAKSEKKWRGQFKSECGL